jgi:hypothetical protein
MRRSHRRLDYGLVMGYSAFGVEHVSKGIGSSAEKAATKLGLARRVPDKSLSTKELKRMGVQTSDLDKTKLDKIKLDKLTSKQMKTFKDKSSLEITGRGKLAGGVGAGSLATGTGAAVGYGALKKSLNYSAFGVEHEFSKGIIGSAAKWLGFGGKGTAKAVKKPPTMPKPTSTPNGTTSPVVGPMTQAQSKASGNARYGASNTGTAKPAMGPMTRQQDVVHGNSTYGASKTGTAKPAMGPMTRQQDVLHGAKRYNPSKLDQTKAKFGQVKEWAKKNPGKATAAGAGAGAGAAGAGTGYYAGSR